MQHNKKRRPLGGWPVNPLTEDRLKLKTLGYDIIPARDKKGSFGWPRQSNDEAAIRKWGRQGNDSTAIRTYGNDVFVIDIDVTIEPVRDELLAAYAEQWPEFMDGCLRRHSGSIKIALIGRCATVRRSIKTRRFFTGPDDTSTGQLVETFGHADKKLVLVHGRHSEGRQYGYFGTPIWQRPVTSLPWFRDEDIGPAIDIAEDVLQQHGLARRVDPLRPSSKQYDLLPDMLFTLSDDEQVTLEELERNYWAYLFLAGRSGGRSRVSGYATIWDPASTTRDRVLVTLGAEGLCLYDTKEDIRHRWKHREPPPDTLGEQIKVLMAQMEAQSQVQVRS